jgi:hypothetical protein
MGVGDASLDTDGESSRSAAMSGDGWRRGERRLATDTDDDDEEEACAGGGDGGRCAVCFLFPCDFMWLISSSVSGMPS